MIRWIRDWRTIAALVSAVLVGLLAVLVITSISDRENALEVAKRTTANEQAERIALDHRIDQLLAQVGGLQSDAQGNAQQLIVLRREVALLQQQVRDLGGQPVIASGGGSSSPEPRASSRGSARPAPTPTHTTPPPSPKPSASRTCLPVLTHVCH